MTGQSHDYLVLFWRATHRWLHTLCLRIFLLYARCNSNIQRLLSNWGNKTYRQMADIFVPANSVKEQNHIPDFKWAKINPRISSSIDTYQKRLRERERVIERKTFSASWRRVASGWRPARGHSNRCTAAADGLVCLLRGSNFRLWVLQSNDYLF